jgi:hypothetical protein
MLAENKQPSYRDFVHGLFLTFLSECDAPKTWKQDALVAE